MTQERRNRWSGLTIEESIAVAGGGLSDEIGIGLGSVVGNGRQGFGLEGVELVEYVRRCLHQIVRRGGRPRHWGKPGDVNRDIPLHYGNDTEDELVEGVIADWLRQGGGDPDWGDFQFILPEKEKFLKWTIPWNSSRRP